MRLIFEKLIPIERESLFAFHTFPGHLALLHEGWCRLRLLKHEDRLRLGAETWVEQVVGGCLPIILGFRHHLLEPPVRFGEELVHGPFSRFRHINEFEAQGRDTVMRDIVDVEWPWQFGGKLALKGCLSTVIREMFRCRGQSMESLAKTGRIHEALLKAAV